MKIDFRCRKKSFLLSQKQQNVALLIFSREQKQKTVFWAQTERLLFLNPI